MEKTLKWYLVNVMLPLALVMTFVTIGAHAAPIMIPQNTTYQEGSGGTASETYPDAILHVAVASPIPNTSISSVVVDASQVNTTGQLSMALDGSSVEISGIPVPVYSVMVHVDRFQTPYGIKNLTATATDTSGSATALLSIIISAQASGPVLVQQNTTYQEGSGGIASEVCPNANLSVAVIDPMGSGIRDVVVDVSQVNVTGQLSMVQTGSTIINGSTALLYSANVYVDKTIRPGGAKSLPVTATDNNGNSGNTSLIIIAFTKMGVSVIGYDSSKPVPAHPANASMFYDHNPVKIVVTSLDTTHFTNVTASFASVDGSTAVEYNNTGVLLPDGNYTYEITHTLGIIPGMENVNQTWINVTFSVSTPSGDTIINIPQIGALTICGNINPRETPGSDLGGDTTDWRTIQDYSAAYLVFEPVNSSMGKIATLQFNEPIDLTNYETAMALKDLGQYLMISGQSMDLNATADALIGFNKASTLTIYNLTAFTLDPGILQDSILVPSSGGVVSNKSWDNSTKTLSFSVAHWTSYSWDGELPSLSSLAVDYPSGQTSVRSGQSVTLHAIVTDSYSGVLNVTADATSIGAGRVIFSNTVGNVWSNTTVVNAANGNYPLTVTAYDRAANKNTSSITVSVDNEITTHNTTIGMYRGGTYYLRNSNTAGDADLTFAYGSTGDIPVTGDWDGDGITTIGMYRGGTYYLRNSNTAGNADLTFAYGSTGDIPVTGDWDGDGITTIGMYRGGTYYLRNTNTAGNADLTFAYGSTGDIPVTGDWTGKGYTSIGMYREGTYYLRNTNTAGNADSVFAYGSTGDTPVTGDWNGDGTTTIGMYRGGTYYLRNTNTAGNADLAFAYGSTGDIPVTGNWI